MQVYNKSWFERLKEYLFIFVHVRFFISVVLYFVWTTMPLVASAEMYRTLPSVLFSVKASWFVLILYHIQGFLKICFLYTHQIFLSCILPSMIVFFVLSFCRIVQKTLFALLRMYLVVYFFIFSCLKTLYLLLFLSRC
jgi:hypothetical protein